MLLEMEIVPETAWFFNLRKLLSSTAWGELRNRVYGEYLYQCYYCHRQFWRDEEEWQLKPNGGGLHAHEIWSYNDDTHVQTINGVVALCPTCHAIKHMILTLKKIEAGELSMEEITNHYCNINQCYPEDFQKVLAREIEIYKERSQHQWTCDILDYMAYINKKACVYVAEEKLIGNISLLPDKLLKYTLELVEKKEAGGVIDEPQSEEESEEEGNE
jgi:hypothetical protein